MTDDEELELDHDEVIRTGMIPPSGRLPETMTEDISRAREVSGVSVLWSLVKQPGLEYYADSCCLLTIGPLRPAVWENRKDADPIADLKNAQQKLRGMWRVDPPVGGMS